MICTFEFKLLGSTWSYVYLCFMPSPFMYLFKFIDNCAFTTPRNEDTAQRLRHGQGSLLIVTAMDIQSSLWKNNV